MECRQAKSKITLPFSDWEVTAAYRFGPGVVRKDFNHQIYYITRMGNFLGETSVTGPRLLQLRTWPESSAYRAGAG